MSYFAAHEIEEKLLAILRDVPEYQGEHHLGRPFLTAYQIAIEFDRRHHNIVEQLGHPLGGAGTGKHYSFATYVARQLSQLVKNNPGGPIEGGFLSNQHLNNITFEHNEQIITSSLTGTAFTLSMFRARQ